MRHRRLEQVTGAEILVKEGQVPEAQVGLLDEDMSIQVTVRLLGGGDPGNQVIYLLLQRRIRMRPEHVRGAFDPLIHVRVRPPRAAESSRGLPGRNVEITNAAGGFELPVHVIEGFGPVYHEARGPEFIVDDSLPQRNLADFEPGRRVRVIEQGLGARRWYRHCPRGGERADSSGQTFQMRSAVAQH